MPDLDVHPADESERLAIYRNVHEFWGGDVPIDEFVARRLESVQHQRATWYAGMVDGVVAASLGCYPLRFRIGPMTVPGFAIGAVHTRPEFRGEGLAPRLFAEVERQRPHDRLAILFSDIGLTYYERLGYVPGRSHVGTAETSTTDAPAEVDTHEVTFDEYVTERDRMDDTRPFAIEHDAEYDAYLDARTPNQRRFVVRGSGALLGTFSLTVADASAEIEEATWPDGAIGQRLVARAIVAAARDLAASRVEGWVPNGIGVRSTFNVSPRRTELTMLKSLDPSIRLTNESLRATDHLHGIDHV